MPIFEKICSDISIEKIFLKISSKKPLKQPNNSLQIWSELKKYLISRIQGSIKFFIAYW